MRLLSTNIPPLKTRNPDFYSTFYDLASEATDLDIAVGYITSDSLIELKRLIVGSNPISKINLIIGMHYFERFTHQQYDTAWMLNDFLQQQNSGEVRIVKAFGYHGKLYAYSDTEGPLAGIIGSDNLSSIVEGGKRIYESSMLIDDRIMAGNILSFIKNLSDRASKNISELEITEFNEDKQPIAGQEGVIPLRPEETSAFCNKKTNVSFEIPLKTTEHSNLNVYFGKGRLQKKTGVVIPRHWYEVELIIPSVICQNPEYPGGGINSKVFDVITDDGWRFKCKVSGDNNKNFRSADNLTTLGKWIKGRLENAGALKVDNMVDKSTFEKYGRDSFTLTKTEDKDVWFIDFGVAR